MDAIMDQFIVRPFYFFPLKAQWLTSQRGARRRKGARKSRLYNSNVQVTTGVPPPTTSGGTATVTLTTTATFNASTTTAGGGIGSAVPSGLAVASGIIHNDSPPTSISQAVAVVAADFIALLLWADWCIFIFVLMSTNSSDEYLEVGYDQLNIR
jgi:hypothetical protein